MEMPCLIWADAALVHCRYGRDSSIVQRRTDTEQDHSSKMSWRFKMLIISVIMIIIIIFIIIIIIIEFQHSFIWSMKFWITWNCDFWFSKSHSTKKLKKLIAILGFQNHTPPKKWKKVIAILGFQNHMS